MIRSSRRLRFHLRLTAFVMLALISLPSSAAANADSTAVRRSRQNGMSAGDYVLAAPSFVLKLPFRILGYIAAGPVHVAERASLLPRIQKMLQLAGPFGLKPVVGYKSRTGLKVGAKHAVKNTFGTRIPTKIKGSISTQKYQHAYIQIGRPQIWGNGRFGLQGEIGWRTNTRDPYFGLGPSTSDDDLVRYGFRGAYGALRGFWQASRQLDVTVFGLARHINPEEARDGSVPYDRDSVTALKSFDDADLFGLFTTMDLVEIGATARFDWRKRPGSPLGGGTEELTISYVSGDVPGDTSIGFWRIHGQASHYINIYRGRVIGLRAMAQHIERDDGTLVPFYEQSRLGGSRTMRGYRNGRFTDLDMALFTVEYRWPLLRALDAVLFAEQGRVFHDLTEDFEFSQFRGSYGGGLRLWSGSGNAEILFAKSRETTGFYLSLGEEF